MHDPSERLQQVLGDRYRVERELGQGGMATVYLAEDLKHHRFVAVKVLRPELSAAVGEARFLQEIKIAARLSHPSILPLHDSGEGDGLLYYVMPYVEGGSLRDRLRATGPLAIRDAFRTIHAVADALVHAHERGLVHRDIKPENILFQADHPVVSDFGIARALSVAGGSSVTATGIAVGTPAYISPEQAVGESGVDHRADIYALGVLAYELFAGEPPFPRATAQQVIVAHLTEVPRAISELRPGLPAQVADLIMRCLEKDPALRPQSAAEVVHTLEGVGGVELAGSVRTDARLAARSALVRATGIYVLAAAGVGAVAWVAMMGLGLPDWVFPGALIVMAAGLPAIVLTAWVHYRSQHSPAAFASRTAASPPRRLASRLTPHLTWRRTVLGTAAALVLFVFGVGGFMTLRAAGVGPAATLLSRGSLRENERLLVAQFDVTGADTALGSPLTTVVYAALEQSTAVSVMAPTALADALRRMQQPPTSRISLELARDIAAREGIKAVVHGQLASVGGHHLLTLRLLEAESGSSLATFSESVRGTDQLIPAVDAMARRLRSRIGESLKDVRASPPLERVTTSSLEALQRYTAGYRAHYTELDGNRAVQLFREAVALDTGFAMAWRMLAISAGSIGFGGAAFRDSVLAAAFRHRHRAGPLERDLILSQYYLNVQRDRAKSIAALEGVIQRDPHDATALLALANMYASRRQFARAESLLRALIANDSSHAVAHANLVLSLFSQGKLDQADSAITVMRDRFPDNPAGVFRGAMLLYHRRDLDAYDGALADLRGANDAGLRELGWRFSPGLAALRGRLVERRRLQAEARLSGFGFPGDTPAGDSAMESRIDVYILGDRERAARRLDASLKLVWEGGDRNLPFVYSNLYAAAGRTASARAVLERHVAGLDTTERRIHQPDAENTRGWIALSEGRHSDAILHFRRGDALPDGPRDDCTVCLPIYLARAYDAAVQPDSAITAFEAFVGIPTSAVGNLAHMLFLAQAHERLGQLYEARGNRSRAVYHYARFAEIWKDADPELQPRVALARRKMAELQ